jgi:hypothetical protein
MKNPTKQADQANYALISAFFALIYLVVQLGFFKTYFKHFPDFEGFSLLHHIHGMLMASWLLLLIIQPLLIRSGRHKAHRFLGKLSYIIAPLVLASMFLVLRLSFYRNIAVNPVRNAIADISFNIPQLFAFALFYSLAIVHKNNTPKHMRYMIGTALIMISAGLGRVLIQYFDLGVVPTLYTALYLQTGLAISFLLYDIIKKKDYIPNIIIVSSFIISTIIYYENYSDAYQAFGRFFTGTLF